MTSPKFTYSIITLLQSTSNLRYLVGKYCLLVMKLKETNGSCFDLFALSAGQNAS